MFIHPRQWGRAHARPADPKPTTRMTRERRVAAYTAQNRGRDLTPRQTRRLKHKGQHGAAAPR